MFVYISTSCQVETDKQNLHRILKDWLSRCNENKIKAVAPHITHLMCSLVLLHIMSLRLVERFS